VLHSQNLASMQLLISLFSEYTPIYCYENTIANVRLDQKIHLSQRISTVMLDLTTSLQF